MYENCFGLTTLGKGRPCHRKVDLGSYLPDGLCSKATGIGMIARSSDRPDFLFHTSLPLSLRYSSSRSSYRF